MTQASREEDVVLTAHSTASRYVGMSGQEKLV